MSNREKAKELYKAAATETDPDKAAERYAEADFLMEDEDWEGDPFAEPTEEELAAFDAGYDAAQMDLDEDDDILFEPDDELLEDINYEEDSREKFD